MNQDVILLSRRDLASAMKPADYLAAVEDAFRADKRGDAFSPLPLHLPVADGGFHAKAARLDVGRCFVAVKFNGNFPNNMTRHGLPTIQGAVLLCDGQTGSLLAILDSIEITLMRTAAATAIAAKHLARGDAETLCICGCGAQGRVQAAALSEVRPFRRVVAWDAHPAKAAAFAAEMTAVLDVPVVVATTLDDAARHCDVIVTCTTSSVPFLSELEVQPGTFVGAVGADNPTKSELAPSLLARSKIVVDAIEQCVEMGDLHHALDAGLVTRTDVHAELGDIIVGDRPGRESDEEIIVFDSTGTALQDAASAVRAYFYAVESGVGQRIAL